MEDPEADYHNFSQPSSLAHRLPTLNGAQALLDALEKQKPISTSLLALDSILCESNDLADSDGGISRGSVTEIYGPPGCGKTHFAIQLASNALRLDSRAIVVWIDTSSALPHSRLIRFLQARLSSGEAKAENTQPQDGSQQEANEPIEDRFHHLYVNSFTHLLSLLLNPATELLPPGTVLLVIDDFSGLVLNGVPQDERISPTLSKDVKPSLSRDEIIHRSIATRRAGMFNALSAALSRLSATRNLAVVVLNKVAANRKSGSKSASMRSALSSPQWNENISTRIVLYRMFWPKISWASLSREERRKQRKRETHALRLAEVERIGGKDVFAEGVKFVILSNRLHAVDPPKPIEVTTVVLPSSPPLHDEENEEAMGNLGLEDVREDEDPSVQMPEDIPQSSRSPGSDQAVKRKFAEIADSEDENDLLPNHDNVDPESTSTTNRGFLPSSQILDEETHSRFASTAPPHRIPRIDEVVQENDDIDNDEMLLRD